MQVVEQQRKFFLKEQLKEIQNVLGIAKDDRTAELDRFKERLATLAPSAETKKRIDEEMDKMSVLEIGSPEYAVTRNYLDWMTSLPWGKYSDDKLDIDQAREVLDRDHEGLDDVKDRIDRMENIHLAGYITREKVAIARNHLWPKQLEKAGIEPGKVDLTDAALEALIEGYARKAGVRNLEKQLGRIVRKSVLKLLKDEVQISIDLDALEDYRGKPLFQKETPMTGVGVVTGLAWTAMGGDTLDVEASRLHTKTRGFKLTGKLGEVMKESAEIAYSFVVSHAASFGVDPGFFDEALSLMTVKKHAPKQ